MKKKFVVTLEMPEGVTISEMKEYINEAVALWCKSYNPQEPLFDLNRNKVKVTSKRKERRV